MTLVPGSQGEETRVVERIKVCLNGGRRREEHPAVPCTPRELAAASASAVAAGAEAVHLHPRDADGRESLRSLDVAAAVSAVREACLGTPVGVSTGLWICDGDVWARQEMVARWATMPPDGRPDFASANVSEPGFAELVEALHRAGIAVEAGVWSVDDADRLAGVGWAVRWARILVEIINTPRDEAEAIADAVLARLDEVAAVGPRLLHGEGAACWPLVAHAGRLGLPTRIGLEDTVVGPSGEAVSDNAHLVRLALQEWGAARPRSRDHGR